jgi:alpha-tubulin suppressor-like RCC1 family protein
MVLAGALSCWGSNANGQLGTGDNSQRRAPVSIGSDADWFEIAAAGRHSCGLRAPGALYCWGDNSQGQLGIGGGGRMGGMRAGRSPTRVTNFTDFAALSCSGDNCCALRVDASLYCWGANSDGNAGSTSNGSNPLNTPTPLAQDSRFIKLGVGAAHSCAVRMDGALVCWGRNQDGELGLGASQNDPRAPGRVGSDSDWLSVACGQQHTCGLRRGGVVLCWGANDDGQVGIGRAGPDGVPLTPNVPTAVDTSHGWADVAAGAYHSCARKDRSAELFCWGRGANGQLGIAPSPDVVESPLRVPVISMVRSFGLGAQHSCAFQNDHQLYCWGDNAQGQLGVGDTQRRDQPVTVLR